MFLRNRINCFKINLILFCLIGLFLWPVFCWGNVIINEIAWMGTEKATDEWIEFYNDGSSIIDIANWSIYGADTEKCLDFSSADGNLTTIIPEYGYLIYANGEDDIKDANGINIVDIWDASIGMNNNSPGKLILYDSPNCQGNEIDIIDQTDSWLTGNKTTKQTMERISDGWQTSLNPGGTPKAENSSGKIEEIAEPELEIEESPKVPIASNYPPYAEAGADIVGSAKQDLFFDASQSWDPDKNDLTFLWNFGDGTTDNNQTTTHSYLYPGQYIVTLLVGDGEFSDFDSLIVNVYDNSIIINEFNPWESWIEIYNQSEQIANLSNWKINDFVFPSNSLISPKQYLVLTKEVTNLELDEENTISLIYPDDSIISQIEYEEEEGCVAFNGEGYLWTETATPGSFNIFGSIEKKLSVDNSVFETKKIEQEKTNLNQKQTFSVEEKTDSEEKYTASLISAIEENKKSKLILILSIIISASLFISWLIILLKKSISH